MSYASWSAAKLREALKARGQKVTGTKAVLIERLEKADEEKHEIQQSTGKRKKIDAVAGTEVTSIVRIS